MRRFWVYSEDNYVCDWCGKKIKEGIVWEEESTPLTISFCGLKCATEFSNLYRNYDSIDLDDIDDELEDDD